MSALSGASSHTSSLLDLESRTWGDAVVSYKTGFFEAGIDLLFERLDLDLIEINHITSGGVDVLPVAIRCRCGVL